ncbi:MAG: pyruvate dehydrogenase complex E1 component subunit beta [Flavobacteriales bacterium]
MGYHAAGRRHLLLHAVCERRTAGEEGGEAGRPVVRHGTEEGRKGRSVRRSRPSALPRSAHFRTTLRGYFRTPFLPPMRTIQFREALNEAMSEEMRRDPNVFLMGEEVAEYDGAYKVSKGMLAEFGPKRIIDTPISELGFTAIGVGAAMNGLRPIVEFMTWNFAVLASDQIINHAAKMLQMSGGQFHIPIVFRGGNGSAGQLAATHSQSYEAFYANIPGLKVITVSNPYDAKGLLKAAIRDDDPVLFLESEKMYGDKGEVPDGEYLLPIGVADVKRKGDDVTIVSFGKMMKVALGAAEELQKEGISAEVIDLRTIRPFDVPTIVNSVKKTNRLVVVDECWPMASIASELAYRVQKDAFDYLDAPVVRINQADTPLPFSPPLIEASLPNVARVVSAVKEVMYVVK